MLRYIARRILETIPTLFVIITATFFMIRFVPGGPFTAEKALPPEILRNQEAYYHLNDPLWKQYRDYMWNICPKKFRPQELLHSLDLKAAFGIDFGPSYKYSNRTVNEIITDTLPASLELGVLSLSLALLMGLPLGVIAAVKRNSWLDYLCSSVSMIGICLPTFVLGPLLVLVTAIYWGWFNASGWYTLSDRVLPAATLGCVYAAYIARLTRGGMLEVLGQDYIRTARAKGAPEFQFPVGLEGVFPGARAIYPVAVALAVVIGALVHGAARSASGELDRWTLEAVAGVWIGGSGYVINRYIARWRHRNSVIVTHALRGGLLPVIAFLGPAIAGIMTGSFVIETIFQIPGLGRQFVNSAFSRDYCLVLGTVILDASLVMLCNLVVDVVLVWLNPKLKFE